MDTVFTTREIALSFWIVVALVAGLSHGGVRESLGRVLKSALHRAILTPILLGVLYTALVVLALRAAGLWTADLLKDTTFWFVFAALPTTGGLLASPPRSGVAGRLIREALRITVIFEFITTTYTFPLFVEVFLVALVTVIATFDAVAAIKPEFADARRITTGTLMVIGLVAILYAVRSAIADYSRLASLDSARAILLGPLLSLAVIPFIYLLLVYAAYEHMFILLRLPNRNVTPDVARYAKRRVFGRCGLSLSKVVAFDKQHRSDLLSVRSRSEVDALLARSR